MSLYIQNLEEHIGLFQRLGELDAVVAEAALILSASLEQECKVMFCGNGGSAADSQHIAAELTGRFIKDRRPLAAMALSVDTSALTCIANDYSYAHVFSRQVEGIGRSGDSLVGISTSGNSPNVIAACEVARGAGIRTIGLLGRDGGKLHELCDVAIVVPSHVTARIQEAHILIGHTLCGLIEEHLQVG